LRITALLQTMSTCNNIQCQVYATNCRDPVAHSLTVIKYIFIFTKLTWLTS